MSKYTSQKTSNNVEIERVQSEYNRRDQLSLEESVYSYNNQTQRFTLENRRREMLALLQSIGIQNLKGYHILEMGCGRGDALQEYLKSGASPRRLHGCDILLRRLRQTEHNLSGIPLTCTDGRNLPYAEKTFDIVYQYTVFTSILNFKNKTIIAREMLRVLKKDGVILWYDFWLNPTNPHTRGIRPSEIRRLFPDCRYTFKKITLAPPITRRLIYLSNPACRVLERLSIFNSHYLAAIQPSNNS